MFAIFFTDAMDPFYLNVTSFPTVFFTLLLMFCIFFWLFAVIGVVDLDFLEIEIPSTEINVNDGLSGAGLLGGLLMRFRLDGVPIPIIVTLISLIGWFFSYYIVHFFFGYLPLNWLRYVIGIPVLLVTLYLSTVLTGFIIRPLRSIFKTADQEVQKNIVGQIAVVRTSRVDKEFGEAKVDDGGAGLILKVRSYNEVVFKSGERVVLLEYDKDKNTYQVISESEFNNTSNIKN
ncbi:MAG: hypothetical protein ACI84K_000277 [Pseudohongiellaceae bacterium]|jgi:hypothetical protein